MTKEQTTSRATLEKEALTGKPSGIEVSVQD